MKTRKLILSALFAAFAAEWARLMLAWATAGREPTAAQWLRLELLAGVLLWWFSFDAVAVLTYKATGRKLALPPSTADKVPEVDRTIAANPDLRELLSGSRRTSFNLAREWRESEKESSARLIEQYRQGAEVGGEGGQSPKRLPRFDRQLFEKSIDYRVRRFRRDKASRIVVAAEDELLKDPEVGDAFPYAEYGTREDFRVRPTHAAMLGFVALRTDEVWQWVTPACGYNCRCYRILRTAREAIARGWMTPDGRAKFTIRWPSVTARANYERGIRFHGNGDYHAVPAVLKKRVFPDPGPWMLSRRVALAL